MNRQVVEIESVPGAPARPDLGADRRFLLTGIRWATYEALLADVGDRPIRLTFSGGDLEIMSPGSLHDRYKHRFVRLIVALTEELEVPIDGCASTTLRSALLEKGLEPDEAFYVRNEPKVRGKMRMDLEVDPPPDLAIEIEITSSSVDREEIHAALGVPELWRHDGDTPRVFRLGAAGKYEPVESSPSFPYLPLGEFAPFIDPVDGEGQTAWAKRFRACVRERVAPLHRAWRAGPDAF